MSLTWSDVEHAAPNALKLLGTGLAMTGVGAPVGALVGGLGTVIGNLIGQEPTPQNVAAAITDPAMLEKFLEIQDNNRTQLQQLAIQKDIQTAQLQAKADSEALLDTQDARKRDTVILAAGKTNWRANIMLIAAYVACIAICVLLVVKSVDGNTAIGGALIGLLGMFAGDIKQAFAFEFGSSRSSQAKDTTIDNALTAANTTIPATSVLPTVLK